jgi:uncharacterized protein involved in exopolysaccharide biosynthesis
MGGMLAPAVSRWRSITASSLVIGVVAFGVTFAISPTFTARTMFLPPQQQQSATASALANLSGALAGLGGAAGASLKNPADQYVSLLQSVTVEDRIVDRFQLRKVYDVEFQFLARKKLEDRTHVTLGKKDGLITVEVEDHDPHRAADMANQYVAELRQLTGRLALSEAQQRRVFFEEELKRTRTRLTQAQVDLQSSGFNPGALRAEPKAAAEEYARLRAQMTSAQVRLNSLRQSLADNAPEVQQSRAQIASLQAQLARVETPSTGSESADYISRYRAFKYEETLFELFSRQYESARLDEAREGALIQVVDPAAPPERKSKPKRLTVALASAAAAFVVLSLLAIARERWRRSRA